MDSIKGKVLVFTDLHLGLKGASKKRLAICVKVVKDIIAYAKNNGISTCVFCGDWHHTRVSTENNVLNVSYKLMSALAKHLKVYAILGNHDIYMKNSSDINSMVIFNDIENVEVVGSLKEVDINGKLGLFIPWQTDVTELEKDKYDFMFGHFEISYKYLLQAYIEQHSETKKADYSLQKKIDNDNLIGPKNETKSAQLVGDFVEHAKKGGTVFAGHIHTRKEFLAKGRNFVFVGSPYQQTLGEKDTQCGFYVIDEDGKHKFIEIDDVPKHVELKMSKVAKSFDTFDFSCVKGNIVHKIYDIEIDRVLDAKISQKINDWNPYEELLPDYEVDIETDTAAKMQNETINLIKKSKLDYIRNYVDNIDKKVLEEQQLQKDKLFKILEKYYQAVADE